MKRLALWMALGAAPVSAELPPGIYAVVCGQAFHGNSRARALAACVRGNGATARACGCQSSADYVTISSAVRPVLYVDCGARGRTQKAAREACISGGKADSCRCGEKPQAIYGPFHRRPTKRTYDDAGVYRWLSESGEWVDEHGEAPCFPSGTPVATPDGPKPIEALSAGDQVLSRDDHGRPITARVTRTKSRHARELVVITLGDRVLRATPNHPIATPDGWVPAGELTPGQPLITDEGERVPSSLATVAADEPVYDLTVEPTHSYFAGGVWVHNY